MVIRYGLMKKCMVIIRTNLKCKTMHKVPVSSTLYFHFSLFHSPVSLSAVDKVKILGKLPLEIYNVEETECYYKEGKQTL